jgi:CheY-like chemotaxis protein
MITGRFGDSCPRCCKSLEVEFIHEVSDGLEAVRRAEELQPDLILLDIGLPKLNGIEAARRIREVSPQSKILFVSQGSSADVVQEAFSTGAKGYVVKTDVRQELPTAVNAVLRGESFVSSRVARYGFTRPSHEKSLGRPRDTGFASSLPNAGISRRHEAGFYSDDALLLDGFTQFIGTALNACNAVIVVLTESHRECLIPRLHAHGWDIAAAIVEGRYISLDAAETLSRFMVNKLPDSNQFLKVTSDLIMTAAKAVKGEPARVAACGECAPLLWAQGNAEAAIQLEHLWDGIARSYAIDVLCGYPLGSFEGGVGNHLFERVCAEHSAVHFR